MMENTLNNSVGHNNRSALIWMLTSVIALSFVVFVIDWGETNKSPFLVTTLLNISFLESKKVFQMSTKNNGVISYMIATGIISIYLVEIDRRG